jgi:hypothetical protein
LERQVKPKARKPAPRPAAALREESTPQPGMVDRRPSTVTQNKLADAISNSPRVAAQRQPAVLPERARAKGLDISAPTIKESAPPTSMLEKQQERDLEAGMNGKDGGDELAAETLGGIYGGITDTTGGLDPTPSYVSKEKDEKGEFIEKYATTGGAKREATEGEKQAAAFGAGVGIYTPLINFYLAVRKIQGEELDKQIEGGFELVSSVSSAVKAGADVGKALNEKDKTASVTSAVSGSVTDGITALKTGVLTIKGIYDAYKDATSAEGSSKGEKIKAGLNATKGLIDSAASTISSLKAILDLFQQASAGLASAIPGLGIALSSVAIAIEVYEIMKAKTNEDFVKAQLAQDKWDKTLGEGKAKRKAQTDNIKLFEKEIARFEKEIGENRKKRAKMKTDTPERQAVDKKLEDLEAVLPVARTQLSQIKQNTALTNLGQINADRQKNSGFTIGVELTKIIASVLSLVPEPGTQAASVTLKAAAAGASIMKKAGDRMKQSARDYAAANEGSFLNKMVDTTRSSEKELARKKESVRYVFVSISALGLDEPAGDEPDKVKEREGKKVQAGMLVATTGMSLEALLRSHADGGVKKASADMLKAMSS